MLATNFIMSGGLAEPWWCDVFEDGEADMRFNITTYVRKGG